MAQPLEAPTALGENVFGSQRSSCVAHITYNLSSRRSSALLASVGSLTHMHILTDTAHAHTYNLKNFNHFKLAENIGIF